MLHEQLAGGVIDLLLLATLSKGDSYGYELTQQLERQGLSTVSEATVYTSLRRLERRRLLSSRQRLADGGRARRYYRVTRDGKHELLKAVDAWFDLDRVVRTVLTHSD